MLKSKESASRFTLSRIKASLTSINQHIININTTSIVSAHTHSSERCDSEMNSCYFLFETVIKNGDRFASKLPFWLHTPQRTDTVAAQNGTYSCIVIKWFRGLSSSQTELPLLC